MRIKSNAFVLSLFGVGIFVLIAVVLLPDFISAARSYTWRKTPCKILSSRLAEEPFSSTVMHHVLKVEYAYAFDGREYTATRFTTGSHEGSPDVTKAQQALLKFAAGNSVTCYVNPRQPAEAVLERGGLWQGLFLLTPFVIVGIMGHEELFGWFERRRRFRRAAVGVPLSEANDALGIDVRHLFFGSIGWVMGIFFLGFCLALPLWNWRRSSDWQKMEATIVRCELESRSSTHGPEYSLQLLYDYEYAGQHYQGKDRDFGHSTSLEDSVYDTDMWAASHPPGSKVAGWVDPADPTQAVLDRGFRVGWISLGLGALMLWLGFTMFGSVGHALYLKHSLSGKRLLNYWRGPVQSRAMWLKQGPPPSLVAIACVLGSVPLLFAGAWSLYKSIRGFTHGRTDLMNLLYGAMAIAGACALAYQFSKFARRAINPAPKLNLKPGTPVAGKEFTLRWNIPSRQPIKWTRISLEGAESAKVRRVVGSYHGTVSEEKTERCVFCVLPLAEASGSKAAAGTLSFEPPAGLMHSFRGFKCAIEWRLKVEFGRHENECLTHFLPVTILPAGS